LKNGGRAILKVLCKWSKVLKLKNKFRKPGKQAIDLLKNGTKKMKNGV
jgi:hypothetical protein